MGDSYTTQEATNSDTILSASEQESQPQQAHQPPSPTHSGAATTTATQATLSGEKKIEILLKNVGGAPIIKKTKWAVRATSTVSEISKFIIRYLQLDNSQSLFIYVNQSFAPALDQTIENLFDCYESDKKLVLYYATSQAWG